MNKNVVSGVKLRKDPNRDEFYTTKETAEELYVNIDPKHFVGKSVYCNCDGPESEIYRYWKTRYVEFGLAKLVATKYVKEGYGVKTVFDGKNEYITHLDSDGDYRSDECMEILRQCDIVTTNPPFSLLDDYIPRILDAGKDMIIIVNMMTLMHKPIKRFTETGRLNICNNYTSGGQFMHIDGHTASVHVIGVTTLYAYQTRIWHRYTTQQLKDKGLFVTDDNDGILECRYMRNLPVDYYEPIYCPISILLLPRFKKYFDIIGTVDKQVTVNGKNRFWRIKIKRNNVEIKD